MTECCDLHSSSSVPPKAESQDVVTNNSAISHDLTSLPNVRITSDGSDHNTSSDEDDKVEQNHHSSDSGDLRLQLPSHINPVHHGNALHSIPVRSKRRHHGTTRFRTRQRSLTYDVKSIVAEPPDASQQDIAKAKRKLFPRTQKLEV